MHHDQKPVERPFPARGSIHWAKRERDRCKRAIVTETVEGNADTTCNSQLRRPSILLNMYSIK
jgi:hypothetical protein